MARKRPLTKEEAEEALRDVEVWMRLAEEQGQRMAANEAEDAAWKAEVTARYKNNVRKRSEQRKLGSF